MTIPGPEAAFRAGIGPALGPETGGETAAEPGGGDGTVLGVDAGSATLQEADHLVRDLAARLRLPPDTLGCTHLVRAERPHVAASMTVPDPAAAWAALTAPGDHSSFGAVLGDREYGPPALVAGAVGAAAERGTGTGGRAVLFAGADRLTGTVSVAELLARSAIDRVVLLGGAGDDAPPSAAAVLTRDHVRPELRDGHLVLTLTVAGGDRFAPFELPNPTPCCPTHP